MVCWLSCAFVSLVLCFSAFAHCRRESLLSLREVKWPGLGTLTPSSSVADASLLEQSSCVRRLRRLRHTASASAPFAVGC
eukprot:5161823-Pleurochrysis_carterae.AAC.3